MRTGKDEKTQMDPLFPRLHINDTEKGGPRAPPRNKMALYEEISVTSQRTSSGSISVQSLPPSKDRSFNPSGSQSHVGSPQKSRFSLFCSWPESSEMAQDHHSCSSTSINFDKQLTNSEIQILKPENYQKFSSTRASKMISECHLFRPFSFYNSKNSFVETVAKEDNLRHPYFSQLDKKLHCGDMGGKLESKKLISTSLSFSEKHQITSGERQKQVKSTDLKSREHLGNSTEDNHEVQMREENPETPSLLSIGKNNLLDATTNQLTRNMTSGSGIRAPMYQAGCNLVNDDKFRLHDPCEQSRKVCRTSQENIARTDGTHENLEKFSSKSCSRMKDSLCSTEDSGENIQILNIKDSVNEFPTRDNDLEIGDAEKSISMSGASLADPKSDFNISPDDVVGVIGPKLFWRVRRTIVHQQRIFAVQIFELHRLIKVQRLVAKSPEMLSEDTPHISEPSPKCSPVEKLLTQIVPEATSSFMKRKADPQGPNWRPETAAEDANAKLPPLDCNSEKGHNTPMSTQRQCSTSSTFPSDIKSGLWYFRPGSQGLLPVRSPSEGLVYKPYITPCPPSLDCIAPVYDSCSPPSLSRIDTENLCTALGVPIPGQHYAQFKQRAMPVVNTSNSSKSLPASKGSEFHSSRVSSPVKGMERDVHTLFPIGLPSRPSCKPIPSNTTETPRLQVIKVVPHTPKLACEFSSLYRKKGKNITKLRISEYVFPVLADFCA